MIHICTALLQFFCDAEQCPGAGSSGRDSAASGPQRAKLPEGWGGRGGETGFVV
jgi:hypothetical protein